MTSRAPCLGGLLQLGRKGMESCVKGAHVWRGGAERASGKLWGSFKYPVCNRTAARRGAALPARPAQTAGCLDARLYMPRAVAFSCESTRFDTAASEEITAEARAGSVHVHNVCGTPAAQERGTKCS